jgi:hypothetical protein
MDPIDYKDLSDLSLLELCVWREARGEGFDGKRGVAHVIRNRVYSGTRWWGSDWHSVILHPYQFSSFNHSDPNSNRWPADDDPAFAECCAASIPIYNGVDEDLTLGATFYYDQSITWPPAWGDMRNYENTFNVGRLMFWKLLPTTNHDAVQDAVTGQ